MELKTAVLAVALLALLAAGAANAASLPSWARNPRSANWRAYQFTQLKKQQAKVRFINASGQAQDFVLYGCSIVTLLDRHRASPGCWDDHFGRGWRATAMGISGNDAADVVWRLLAGGEMPARPPRVIGFLMAGHDDLESHREIEWLLRWLRRNLPQTKVLLMGMLPFRGVDVRGVNAKYAGLARKNGATFLDCGSVYNPYDTRISYDAGHPTLLGQRVILDCMYPVVKRLARK